MKTRDIFRWAADALTAIFSTCFATYAMSAPQSAVLQIQPTHDAYVRSSTPTTSYSSAATLRLRKSSSETVTSYLKFEMTGVNGIVLSAKLRLYVTDASSDGGSVYLVSNNYLGTETPWTQGGLNWNNAPPISGTALSSAGSVSVNSWVEFEVTSAITGNGTFSFGLKSNASDVVYYSSKEGGNKPELVIESDSGPPPPPSLAVASPNGGESWTIGSTRTIRWSSTGSLANVSLEFSDDAGATWSTISSSTPNDGDFDWTIPDAESNQCLVRIADVADSDPVDVSDGVFSVVASNPIGQVLPDLKIWVNATTPISLYDAQIKVVSGETRLRFSNAAVNVGAGALEMFGVVDNRGEQPAYQRIYHEDGNYEDVLVGVFVFAGHEDHNHFHFQDFAVYRLRQVTSGDGVGPVLATSDKISFCITDSDEYDGTLPNAPSSHVYDCDRQGMSVGWGDRYGRSTEGQWIVINGVADGNYWLESEVNPDRLLFETRYDNNSDRIKISINKSTGRVKVLSDLLTLTEPNGGEKWRIGSRQTIKWKSAGKVSNVKLEYSTNGGGSWVTITTSTTNDSSHSWTVPDAVSSSCLVRISDAADGKPIDESDVTFSITASSSAALASYGGLMESGAAPPKEFRLAQNHPNPFNPETRIRYELPEAVHARLTIYDILGREVVTVLDEEKPAGRHSLVWNSRDADGQRVSSGLYFYRLRAGSFMAVRKMLLVQ
jgi:hypothetical protein